MTISKTGSLSVSIATSMDIWQRNAEQRRRNEKHEHVLNATRRKSRVLAKISSRHSTRDLLCKFPE